MDRDGPLRSLRPSTPYADGWTEWRTWGSYGAYRCFGERARRRAAHEIGDVCRGVRAHPVVAHVRDRADPHLQRDDVVPLRLRRDLDRAVRDDRGRVDRP